MADPVSNSPGAKRADRRRRAPDAHGQAALLLVESLVHALIARSILTVSEAIEIVAVATDVKADSGIEMGDTAGTLARSLTLLDAIRASLANDLRA